MNLQTRREFQIHKGGAKNPSWDRRPPNPGSPCASQPSTSEPTPPCYLSPRSATAMWRVLCERAESRGSAGHWRRRRTRPARYRPHARRADRVCNARPRVRRRHSRHRHRSPAACARRGGLSCPRQDNSRHFREVIDRRSRGRVTFLAAERSFPDIAAGNHRRHRHRRCSTEIIVARAGHMEFRRSLPVGSVRLTEKHIRNDRPRQPRIAAVLARSRSNLQTSPSRRFTHAHRNRWHRDHPGRHVAWTCSYDPQIVHGHRLTLPALNQQIARLRPSTPD